MPSSFRPLEPSGPAFSILGRAQTPEASEAAAAATPGPGQYFDPASATTFRQLPAFSFGNAVREVAEAPGSSSADALGPGAYSPEALDRGPAFTFAGKTELRTPAAEHPGPGQYDLTKGLEKGPAFTIGVRHAPTEEKEAAARPAPGEYDLAGAMIWGVWRMTQHRCV